MGFPTQEYWSGLLFPSPVDLPKPEIEPVSPALAGRFFTTAPPGTYLLNNKEPPPAFFETKMTGNVHELDFGKEPITN